MLLRKLKINTRSSVIQISGMTLALLACMFIFGYSIYELSFDKFHEDKELIFRSKNTEPKLVGGLAKQNINYVDNYARLHPCYRGVSILTDDKAFYDKQVYFADGSLFEILSFEVIQGNAIEALNSVDKAVISESKAIQFFGNENPIGKVITINGAYEHNIKYTISAVYKDIPMNCHIHTDILFSMQNILKHDMYSGAVNPWKWGNFYTYFRVSHPVNKEVFNHDLAAVANANGASKYYNDGAEYSLYKIEDLHLNGEINFMDNNITKSQVNIRIAIAFIIMFIAWLNMININLGDSLKNSMQTGVKKVLGATGRHIWFSQLSKLLVINVVSLLISMILYFALLPVYENITGKSFHFSGINALVFWAGILLFQIMGVFFVSLSVHNLLNRQKIVNMLYKKREKGQGRQSLWLSLLVLQFTASVVMICFAIISTKQVNTLMELNTGMDTWQVLTLNSANTSVDGDIFKDRYAFEQEVVKIPGVKGVSSSSYVPGSQIASFMPTRLPDQTELENIQTRINWVGYDYIPMMTHRIIAGRNFSEEFSTDNTAIIINETLCKQYGFATPQDAIGKDIYWQHKNVNRKIIAVMEDFHQQSADVPVEPLFFSLWEHARGYCYIKMETTDVKNTISQIENVWSNIHHGNVFSYFWLDDFYNSQFNTWIRYSNEIKLFSAIAILIACIGLFGLSAMIIENRTKEIGVRKVNGARITDIVLMLNSGIVKWLAVAFILALPISYFIMNKWLQNFAYKTNVSWWVFALSGFIVFAIALLTVSKQSLKAATRNPVEALRYE